MPRLRCRSRHSPPQGLDKLTTTLVTRVEARPGGRSALRTRFKVEASVYGVQRKTLSL